MEILKAALSPLSTFVFSFFSPKLGLLGASHTTNVFYCVCFVISAHLRVCRFRHIRVRDPVTHHVTAHSSNVKQFACVAYKEVFLNCYTHRVVGNFGSFSVWHEMSCPAATPFNWRNAHALGICRLCVRVAVRSSNIDRRATLWAWPENLLPLRNVCQFYAKQNQNRKSLSSVSLLLPLRFLHRPETKELKSKTRFTIRRKLHVCMRMKRKKEQKQCNSPKEKWRNEPLAVMFCVVCVWVPCFKWISIFYFFFGKKKNWGNCQRPKQSSISCNLLLSYVWHAFGSYFVQYGSLQSSSTMATTTTTKATY